MAQCRTFGAHDWMWALTEVRKAKNLKKTGNIVISENVSGDVPKAGAFSNQFLEGMKQLYELEPLLKICTYRPHSTLAKQFC